MGRETTYTINADKTEVSEKYLILDYEYDFREIRCEELNEKLKRTGKTIYLDIMDVVHYVFELEATQ